MKSSSLSRSLASIALVAGTSIALVAGAFHPALAGTEAGTAAAGAPLSPTPSPSEPAAIDPIAPTPPVDIPPPTPAIDPTVLAALIDARLDERERDRDRIVWKDGFALESRDGAFKLRIGGYTHFDSRVFLADDGDRNPDQFTFRRIRPEAAGTVLDRAEFRLLPDFAGGRVTVQDAYVELTVAAPLKLRFGKFKEPFGLERLQSATALVFVERGLPTALAPNRDLGIQAGGALAANRVTYALGIFNGVADGASSDGDATDDKGFVARVFLTPFAAAPKHPLAQLGAGAAVSLGDQHGTAAAPNLPTLRTAGQATFFSYRTGTAADATAIADGRHLRVTGHGHFYRGPVGVLAEWIHTSQVVALGTSRTAVASDAWQLAVNLVVLGGTASAKGTTATTRFDPGHGHWGAVELAARYHQLTVASSAFTFAADPARAARRARAFAAGTTWILGKSLRFLLDYEQTRFTGGAADATDRPTEHAVLGRVQTVF